jgi:hypothetical protein
VLDHEQPDRGALEGEGWVLTSGRLDELEVARSNAGRLAVRSASPPTKFADWYPAGTRALLSLTP